MKIIEALKELPLIEKKLEKNRQLLTAYAASVDAGTAYSGLKFDTPARQTEEVSALIQSCEDLVARKARVRKALAVTNAGIQVTIDGVTKSITEWIEYNQRGFEALERVYGTLSENHVANEARNAKFEPTQGIRILRHYDEKGRNVRLQQIMETKNKIDTTLETVNATTDLLEEVA